MLSSIVFALFVASAALASPATIFRRDVFSDKDKLELTFGSCSESCMINTFEKSCKGAKDLSCFCNADPKFYASLTKCTFGACSTSDAEFEMKKYHELCTTNLNMHPAKQSLVPQGNFSTWPACSTPCLSTAVNATSCPTDTVDPECICTSTSRQGAIDKCIFDSCDPNDAAVTFFRRQSDCGLTPANATADNLFFPLNKFSTLKPTGEKGSGSGAAGLASSSLSAVGSAIIGLMFM